MDDRLCHLVNLAVNSTTATMENRDSVLGYILLLIILIMLNAFFAASELAIVSFNDAKLEKLANDGNKKAKALYNLTVKPTKFLSTIQIGVTLSGFLSSAVAADTFADYIVYWMRNVSISSSTVRLVSIFVITLLLSFVTLVFGELLPKRIAMKDPEKISFAVVGPISFFYKVFKPLVWVVSKTVDAIANSLGIKESDGQQEFTEEEIRIMVDAGTEKGFIEYDEKDMINNIFDFNDRTVGEVMTHRTDMVSLSIDDNLETVVNTFLQTGYSRIPVYDEDIDDIEGIIYVKDLLRLLADDKREFAISDYLRKVLFVYENMMCDELLPLFQKQKVHIAIVLDEYGGTYGIITMEDLLEYIVGNIQDEYDDEEEEITEIKENHYIVDGAAIIDDVSKMIKIYLDDTHNDTIGGLVMDLLGYVPEIDEKPTVILDNVTFTIVEMDEQSIEKIEIVVDREKDLDA
ncbi:MAG: hemolysin family protein [Bacillota bacterium]|jgi:putative hemolysin|nr:hemolysin family protein [Bacillota bacterium]NLL25930.1 HlyC/CorC family transporter [Erysipelotrichia bacterium]